MCPKTQEEMDYMSKVPYASTVGSLMYAMVFTRPDIAHAVGVVSRYMNNPGKEHWMAVKWILRYLRGTPQIKHYALVVQTFLYRDMLMQIWQVTEIIGGALQDMYLL